MSILSPQAKSELFAKLDEIGEVKARENLAQKVYGSDKIALVNEWLRKQKEIRNQEESAKEEGFRKEEIRIASEATEEARKATLEARSANEISREANEFAREANSISLSANDSAKEAIRVARQNKNIAIAAFIISSITAIVAIIISLDKK